MSPVGTILELIDRQGTSAFVEAGDGNLWQYNGSGWALLGFQ